MVAGSALFHLKQFTSKSSDRLEMTMRWIQFQSKESLFSLRFFKATIRLQEVL